MQPIKILLCALFLMGCSNSKLTHLQLEVGMERARVEELVANALGTTKNYSPYANNLRGGVVEYSEGSCVLEVTYRSGAPAPWVINAQGVAEHYPPIDETVISFRKHEKD